MWDLTLVPVLTLCFCSQPLFIPLRLHQLLLCCYPAAQCPFLLKLCKGPDGIPSVLTDSYKHPTLKDMHTVHSAFITFDLLKNNLFVSYIFNLDMNSQRILDIYLHSSVQCLMWGNTLNMFTEIACHWQFGLTWLVSMGQGMKEAWERNWVVPNRSLTPSASRLYSLTGSNLIFSFGSKAS